MERILHELMPQESKEDVKWMKMDREHSKKIEDIDRFDVSCARYGFIFPSARRMRLAASKRTRFKW